MSLKEVCKRIIKIGGELVRTNGSHRHYKMSNGKLVTVLYPKKMLLWNIKKYRETS